MSKRSEEREHLARQLDAGEITQARYDERMARLGHRGAPQQSRHRDDAHAKLAAKIGGERRGPKLHGDEPKEPIGFRLDPAAIELLRAKAARAGLPLAQAIEAAIRQWRQ